MMGKMSELDLCVSELRSVAQSLTTVADSLATLFSGNQAGSSAKAKQSRSSRRPRH